MRVDQQLESKKAQLQYTNNVLSNGGLQAWEEKEYRDLSVSYAKEIENLEAAIEGLNAEYGIGGW